MLIPPFLFLEPVQVVHHLSEGRSMFGLVRARVSYQWYDATVGPPCRPAAALTLGMFATWLSTIVAVLVILVKSLLGSKAKRA